MSSAFHAIDLGPPYHDPTSPLYTYSLSSKFKMPSTNSNAEADYFSHHPRSFLSRHTDFDEKLAAADAAPSPMEILTRGRRQERLVGYSHPAQSNALSNPSSSSSSLLAGVGTPRVPRTRTLIRLLALGALAFLATLGWRCEAVGCQGRGGGGLVGEWVGGGSVVGGGLDGWEGLIGVEGEGLDDDYDDDYDEDVEGELVEWDDEEEGFTVGGFIDWDGVEGEDEVQVQDEIEDEVNSDLETADAQQDSQQGDDKPEDTEDDQPEKTLQPLNRPEPPTPTGPVGELTGPDSGAAQVIPVPAAAAAAQNTMQEVEQGAEQEGEQEGEQEDSTDDDDSTPDTVDFKRDDAVPSDDSAGGARDGALWSAMMDLESGLW